MPDTSWDMFLAHLDTYINGHGHGHVPQAFTATQDNAKPYPLGRKVNEARTRHRNGTLSNERTKQLNDRTGWTWDSAHAQWMTKLEQAQAHHTQHGTLTGAPKALHQWILRQRWANQANNLSPEKQEALTAVPGLLHPESLDDFIAAAKTWLAQNPGSTMADVKRRDRVDTVKRRDFPLGAKTFYYRRRHTGKEGRHPLPAAHAQQLEQLPGWTPTTPLRANKPV